MNPVNLQTSCRLFHPLVYRRSFAIPVATGSTQDALRGCRPASWIKRGDAPESMSVDASGVFDELPDRRVNTWICMISGWARNGHWQTEIPSSAWTINYGVLREDFQACNAIHGYIIETMISANVIWLRVVLPGAHRPHASSTCASKRTVMSPA